MCGTGSNASLTQGRARRAQGGGGCKARRQRKSVGLMVRHARTHTDTHTRTHIYSEEISGKQRKIGGGRERWKGVKERNASGMHRPGKEMCFLYRRWRQEQVGKVR